MKRTPSNVRFWIGLDEFPNITPAEVFGLFTVMLRSTMLRKVPGGDSQLADLMVGQHREQGSPWHGLYGPEPELMSCCAGPIHNGQLDGLSI